MNINAKLIKWLIAGAVLLLLLLFVHKLIAPPVVGGDVLAQLPPAEQAQRQTDAQQVRNQVSTIATQGGQHARAPFSLVVTQDQLNTLMQQQASTNNATVRDMHAEISAGGVTFQGVVPYKGINVTATLSGTVAAEGGRLAYHASSLLLGNISAPNDMKTGAEQTTTAQLNLLVPAGSTVNSVTVESGKLTISGVTS